MDWQGHIIPAGVEGFVNLRIPVRDLMPCPVIRLKWQIVLL